ncbi:MAG: HIRAN domain-containing protein [Anaerolineaceae bacterium]
MTTKSPKLPIQEDSSENGFFSKVAGVSFRNEDGTPRQQIIRNFAREGSELVLIREPINKYDKNAIGVWLPVQTIFSTKQYQLGYLESRAAEELAPIIDKGGKVTAKITSLSGEDQNKIGVNIFISIIE